MIKKIRNFLFELSLFLPASRGNLIHLTLHQEIERRRVNALIDYSGITEEEMEEILKVSEQMRLDKALMKAKPAKIICKPEDKEEVLRVLGVKP